MKSSFVPVLLVLALITACDLQSPSSQEMGKPQTVATSAAVASTAAAAAEPVPSTEPLEQHEPEELFGICGGMFRYGEPRALKEGMYYSITELAGIALMSRLDQSYWIVNLDENVGGVRRDPDGIKFEMFLLDGKCLAPLGDFVSFPSRCVTKKEWRSWPYIRNWLKGAVDPKDYAKLINSLEGYLRKKDLLKALK